MSAPLLASSALAAASGSAHAAASATTTAVPAAGDGSGGGSDAATTPRLDVLFALVDAGDLEGVRQLLTAHGRRAVCLLRDRYDQVCGKWREAYVYHSCLWRYCSRIVCMLELHDACYRTHMHHGMYVYVHECT